MNLLTDFLILLIKFVFFVAIFCYLYLVPFRLYFYIKGFRRIKGEYKYIGYGNFFKKLFFDFPKTLAYDLATRNPDAFRDFGFHMICGKQGSGKTITLVYLLMRYQKMYPKLKVATNMYYKYQDNSIEHWKDIVFRNNGIYGQVDVLDEVQNWFSCNQSKDFPPDMLREITQQRKQRKVIFGTSQVFSRVAKPIREQVYMVYEPITLFGCLTIVRKYEPELDSKDGSVVKSKPRGIFWFVHSKEIRNAFDTYQKIKDVGNSGFIDSNKQISSLPAPNVSISNYNLFQKK